MIDIIKSPISYKPDLTKQDLINLEVYHWKLYFYINSSEFLKCTKKEKIISEFYQVGLVVDNLHKVFDLPLEKWILVKDTGSDPYTFGTIYNFRNIEIASKILNVEVHRIKGILNGKIEQHVNNKIYYNKEFKKDKIIFD